MLKFSNPIHLFSLNAKMFIFLSITGRTQVYSCLLISSQYLNLGGRRGTTDDVATIPFHPSLSSAALRESPNPIPVHSLMLSSHIFLCLPLLLAPFTAPCRIVFDMPEDLEILCTQYSCLVSHKLCPPPKGREIWFLVRILLASA